ncbi:hypothetical protein H2203_007033 [Taxawa tesnikishii (nom. ined.)]|nr:hypothetical protein H2203_007033 [Dothideales sp. JES 119]
MVDYEKHDARRLEEGIAHSPTQSDYTCSTLRADTFKSEEPKTEQLPAETGQTQDADLQEFEDGYPNLAAFKDSSECFMLYRRFGYLQARLLLDLQDEMRQLEEQLDAMDRKDEAEHLERLLTRALPEKDAAQRRELLAKIKLKFCEYSTVLTAAQQLMAFKRPSASEYRSVVNYLDNEKPVTDDERSYILHREDLVTLRPGREHAWLDRSIENVLHLLHRRPFLWVHTLFSSEETRKKSAGANEVYYTRSRIELCATLIITIGILVLLILPIYLLYHLVNGTVNGVMTGQENAVCIGILLVFTLLFSAVLSLFTRARRHEILGAAAAYCAVLVVFLGNVRPN